MTLTHDSSEVSAWVARWAPLVPNAGRVLDLACGTGRHALHFAKRGHAVLAVDRDGEALAHLEDAANIETRRVDLESGAWPLGEERFAAIAVTNYLHRPLLPTLADRLAEGGVLIYETFMLGNERFGKPSNPAFLLRPEELLEAFASLRVVAFEQGETARPKPAMVQRLCAAKGEIPVSLL